MKFIQILISDRGNFQRHHNRVIGIRHDPGTLRMVHEAGSFQSLRQRGMQWGLEVTIRKAPAVPQMLNACVVAQKIPSVTEMLRLNYVRI